MLRPELERFEDFDEEISYKTGMRQQQNIIRTLLATN
jgi:hypothetical protein